jgi:hypothetical protein
VALGTGGMRKGTKYKIKGGICSQNGLKSKAKNWGDEASEQMEFWGGTLPTRSQALSKNEGGGKIKS